MCLDSTSDVLTINEQTRPNHFLCLSRVILGYIQAGAQSRPRQLDCKVELSQA